MSLKDLWPRDEFEQSIILVGFLLMLVIWAAEPEKDIISGAYAQVVSTGLLVLAGLISAAISHRHVEESRKAREQEFMPLFGVRTKSYSINQLPGIKITNIGNGPAHEVNLKVSILPDGPDFNIEQQNIRKDDFVALGNPFNEKEMEENLSSEELVEKYEKIKIKGECKDVFGNKHHIEQEYLLNELLGRSSYDLMLKDDDRKKHLKNIAKELKKIRREIKKL